MLYCMGNALKRVYLAFFWPESGVFGFTTQGQSEVYNCPSGRSYRVTSGNLGLCHSFGLFKLLFHMLWRLFDIGTYFKPQSLIKMDILFKLR